MCIREQILPGRPHRPEREGRASPRRSSMQGGGSLCGMLRPISPALCRPKPVAGPLPWATWVFAAADVSFGEGTAEGLAPPHQAHCPRVETGPSPARARALVGREEWRLALLHTTGNATLTQAGSGRCRRPPQGLQLTLLQLGMKLTK